MQPPRLLSSNISSTTVKTMTLFIMLTICFSVNNSNNYSYGFFGGAAAAPKNYGVPAILVFGDSIVDPGNNNHLQTLIKCDFPPYGRDFMGGRSTGRFSNGFVPSDMIAQIFGIKELVPAYLDPNLSVQDIITGVSFASGGTGFDPLTPKIVSVLSMSDQLDLFKKYLVQLRDAVGEERRATILSKAIFIVCAGSDDLANTYYSSQLRSAHYDISSYTDLMVSYASSFVQELYALGARKIGVFSAPPIGCVPSQRTSAGGVERSCVEPRNQAALLYNSKLSSQLKTVSGQFQPGTKLVYLDVYSPLLAIIKNPTQNGFEEATKGCCGTGTIEVTLLCNRYSPGTCSDPSKYVFWDSYHPTLSTYKILVHDIFSKYSSEFF